MKRSILLFTVTAGIGLVTLMSNEDGPAWNGQGDRTGGPSSSGTCAGGGCHASASASTTVAISLFDKTDNLPVTNKYTGGHLYEVTLNGTVANSGSLPEFGFQATALKTDNSQSGTYTLTDPNHRQVSVGSKKMVEHNTPLTAAGSVYSTKFDWTPASGDGPVTIYAIMNAVNGNGQATGDQPGLGASLSLTEATSSVAELPAAVSIKTYPNPVTSTFRIEIDGGEPGSYSIFIYDITGREVQTLNLPVNSGNQVTELSSASWTNGLYFIRIMKNGAQRIIPVSKQ